MDQDDEKISMLLGMGFPDVQAIKRALRLSNGDMNDAVTYLTENVLPSYNTVDDLRDVDMPDASTMGSAPPEYSCNSSGKQSNNLEFPATNLYELESRLFGESWVIPYKREESLGLCLIAATKLAEEGLCEADETCQRFLEKCLPECFQKLLNSLAVRRWGSDIQEGVLNMIDLLIDIIIARLRKGTLPEDLLRNSLSLVFDSEIEWNQKNKHRGSEYIGEVLYAEHNSKYECFGWLMDIINMFGNKGGFDLISKRLQEMEDLDAGQMAALFMPVAHCAKYMTKNIVSNLFHSSIEKAIVHIVNLEEKELKGKRIKYCYQLLEAVRTICEIFWPDEVQNIISIHLDLIIKMLRTPHFSARMVALKELGILIGNSEKQSGSVIESDYIQDWMTSKAVLSLALEGNLDQVQYTDRMKQLVEFLGPKLKEEELSKIWNLCEKASPHVVDNIHRIMVAAATRFSPRQFDHLLKLIRKSWEFGNDRLREKLLSLIGKIGQDSRYGRTTEKMLDVLWELARVPSLPPHLVHLAIDEHLRILNESVIREQLRKSYISRCVEDIKRSPAVYLPLKQLHHLTKSVSRGSSSYSKSEKATLSELNANLDIVCLITQSLSKSHELAVQTCKNEVPSPDTLIDGKYTHADYIFAHLDFLQFLLKEGDIYLEWPRCKEIWDTLVNNSKASLNDKETCFSWFSQCIDDLVSATQRSLFDERLLHLDSSTLSPSAFGCFVDYFRAINIAERKIAKARDKIVVESLEPLGLEFIWEIVLECLDQQLADEAISLLLDMAYMALSSRLKRDPPQIHQKFISQCYSKLEKSLLHMNQSTVGSALSNAAKTLSAMAVSEIASLSPASKRSCLQHIFRILILVERYISTVEEQFSSPRVLLPHAACFFGKPVTLYVFFDGNNNEVTLQCHSNEQMRSVYCKIAQSGSHIVDQLQQITFEKLTQLSNIQVLPSSSNQVDRHQVIHVSGTEHENKLLHQLCNFSSIKATVKVSSGSAQLKEVSSSSNWNELPDTSCYADNQEDSSTSSSVVTGNTNSQTTSSSSCPSPSGSVLTQSAGVETSSLGESKLKEEKKLPGVVMAGLGKNVFHMLYQLSLLEDSKILDTVRRILYLIPTDPTIADKMDSICSSGSAGSVANSLSNFGGKTSQSNSPAKKERCTDQTKKKEANLNVLRSLLELEGSEITPFRLLYNVEVLSSKLISVEGMMQFDSHFSEEFLSCGGLSILISLLHRESLPQDMDYEVRQSIYLIVLQLLRYMLCGKEENVKSEDQDIPMSYHQYPQPPKRSAFDAYTLKKESLRQKGASLDVFHHQRNNMVLSSSSNLAALYLQNMTPEEWLEMVSSIMRVAWASAAGKLFLCSTGMASLDPSLNSPDSYKSSRENSTGSAHSSGSESERTFQGGICMQQSSLNPTDALIAIEALPLLITSLSLRSDLIEKWYNLPSVKEFIIELLIGCSSWNVREKACQQFIRLTTIKTTNSPQPSQFLTQILHKARLPLWVSSTSARGATLKFVSQCSQYFDLISHLLSSLTQNTQDILNINASQMIEDEIVWMLNFTSTREATRERPESGIALLRNAENLLVAGHLKLISSLLTCENIDKMKCGEALIPLLIYEYLFPSSKLVLGPASNSFETFNKCSAKCTGTESRMAAYMLLSQVAVTSLSNFKTLSKNLVSLHHQLDRDSIKEFERCPVVEGRCPSGFVGLKNGGATCYMNSVLQQLFLVPGIQEDILSVNSDEECDDSLFFQLQNLFGHLLESQLQYYTPENFWSCVSMGGQPINIREQQDAFEFYSRLTEQIDDYLKGRNLESVFSRRFEGLYSIQRICQDCPHRYEREEPFLALNLTITKCSDLHDSLDQLVKGELLEGDNAYYCEKCSKKRTAVIRSCIKTLPQVLVIQLKRFGYDWEASRALKFDDYYKFPWTLDMGEYTVEALSSDEKLTSPSKGDRDSDGNFLSNMDPPSSIKTPKSTPKTPKSPNATSTIGGKSSKHSPLKLSMPSPAKFFMPRKLMRKRYELVGVIVHSGQANAGHYYSYIKDRRGDPISNPNKSKWFKFNDTTVEHVEMTNALLEQECFGGTYKAKVSYDSSNPMPEDRLRYWNAYMLFYDTIDDLSCTPKTPKTPRITGRTSRSLRASASSARKNLSLGGTTSDFKSVISSSDLATSPSSSRDDPAFVRAAQTSLCELSELLKRGEKQGMFRQQMPPRILATITHDNLTFLRDKDLYSTDYFSFIYNACFLALETFKQKKGVNSEMLIDTVSLGLKFLLNTYLRTRGKEVSVVQRWLELLTEMLEKERNATSWCVHYFGSSEGELHIQPLLLECPDKMVRAHFGNLLNTIILCECKQTEGTASVEVLVKSLLSLLASEVSAHVKTSEQYFTLLYNYCLQGSLQCEQVLKLGGFDALMQFLLGPSETNMRRWSPVHAQDFGPLHSIIAALILHSDTSIKQLMKAEPLDEDYDNPIISPNQHPCGLPSAVADVVYGPQRDQWLKEVVLAYREVVGGIPQLTEALKLLCKEDNNFSFALIAAIMKQYGTAPSNLLKDLSILLLEILSLQDSLHSDRIGAVLGGFYSTQGTEVHGLLNLIEANKDSDSRRAYQCIKLIVYLAARSTVAREQLTDTQTNWQWAVEWLKSKMDSHPLGASGVGGSSVSDLASGSNEDSSSRSFQRTTSAQWTLDEATALLSGMESIDMEIEPEDDEDEELADIKESPENDNNPSVGEFTSDS